MKNNKINIDKFLGLNVRTASVFTECRNLLFIKPISLCLVLLMVTLSSCSKKNEIYKRSTFSMGTTIIIQVKNISKEYADKGISKAFREIERLNQKYSTYIDSNWMWQINNTKNSIKVDDETYYLLKQSDKFFKLTNGAYDPAIGNYIELLGFENGSPKLPSQKEILDVLKNVGWKQVDISQNNLFKKNSEIKLSFNAIVAGYAVDRMSKILEENGIENYLINGGGEIASKGNDWKIGIQHPRKNNEILGVIIADGFGVATSGDYQQFFEENGKRYSHLINPLNGLPAEDTEAVTIIAENAETADALSTGIFVLGPENGMKLIEELQNVEGIIVNSSGEILTSSGLNKFFRRN